MNEELSKFLGIEFDWLEFVKNEARKCGANYVGTLDFEEMVGDTISSIMVTEAKSSLKEVGLNFPLCEVKRKIRRAVHYRESWYRRNRRKLVGLSRAPQKVEACRMKCVALVEDIPDHYTAESVYESEFERVERKIRAELGQMAGGKFNPAELALAARMVPDRLKGATITELMQKHELSKGYTSAILSAIKVATCRAFELDGKKYGVVPVEA